MTDFTESLRADALQNLLIVSNKAQTELRSQLEKSESERAALIEALRRIQGDDTIWYTLPRRKVRIEISALLADTSAHAQKRDNCLRAETLRKVAQGQFVIRNGDVRPFSEEFMREYLNFCADSLVPSGGA